MVGYKYLLMNTIALSSLAKDGTPLAKIGDKVLR